MDNNTPLNNQQMIIAELSQRLVDLQRPIRILDSIKWDEKIKQDFLTKNGQSLPVVTPEFYQQQALSYDIDELSKGFMNLNLDIKNQLGSMSPLSLHMQDRCHEYLDVLRLIKARGTKEFGYLSQQLFGSSHDAFHVGGPNLNQLALTLEAALPELYEKTASEADVKKFTSAEVVKILTERLSSYFDDPEEKISVVVSDSIIADASAGAEVIRINTTSLFSERDIRILEVHEGWVHLATTLNGRRQPICRFLSKGTPSATITQEGLALITEIFTFSAYPARVKRMCNRIHTVSMVEDGGNFLDVYNYLRDQGLTEEESYSQSVRVFRGSLPDGSCGAFTKDISYSKGLVLIYSFIRLAVKHGAVELLPLLFIGKISLKDIPLMKDLLLQKLINPPKYLPLQFRDLAALSSWMSYALFMTHLDMDQIEMDFRGILRI